jgi:NADPH-dependent glutamate synthase beta subunit-like oxidoreductase
MPSKHLVAIIGGAVSGAEAAYQLSQKGFNCVVFDQNRLPYGKIEDGLPKWHSKLRDKEEGKIDEKLSHPLVQFAPGVRLGRDIEFEDITRNWGFSAILLAIGAWKDRPLPVDGADAYVGKGLIYQNPFIYWFNHKHEPGFDTSTYEIKDGAIVIGGGLASLDVVKVLMIETVQKALKERGHDYNMFQLDRSIVKVLDELDLSLDDLGIEGCTLYYRRRIQDMPLSPFPVTSPEALAKAELVRTKVLNNYASKYLFKVKPQHVPIDTIVEDGRLAGLVFKETKIEDGRAVAIDGSEKEVRAPYVISSIGSIPEMIEGIPSKGSSYKIIEEPYCRIEGYENVFALGNTVTGRGNIKESMKHGREIAQRLIAQHIEGIVPVVFVDEIEGNTHEIAHEIDGIIPHFKSLSESEFEALEQRIRGLQQAIGYDGDYAAWIAKHLPVRLEDMVGRH